MKRYALGLVIAMAARADITQTITFGDGAFISMDTGKMTTSPAVSDIFDIQWSGGALLVVGKASLANVGVRTTGQFPLLTESDIKLKVASGGVKAIASATLVTDDVFYVLTNFGNACKAQVVRNASGIMTINFVTYQSAAPGAPKITGVFNNSSLIGPGLPNSGIAPSSIFIVQGTGMADTGDPVLQSSAAPGLPLTFHGASIAVVVAGVTTHPAIYYTSPTQIAAVLPANTPVGSGNLTVSYNGLASAPFAITVVKSAPGLNYYGINSVVATDAVTGSILTFQNAASPGQTIVLWATGIGSDAADSDTTYTTSPHAVNTNLQIYFGGTLAKILYAGSAGYPGVNQINVVIPDSVTTGCWVSVAALIDNVVSNIETLPINKGGGECFDPASALKGSQLAQGGLTYRAGFVRLFYESTASPGSQYMSTANFARYTNAPYKPTNVTSPGSCIIQQTSSEPIPGFTILDAGVIALKGPAGLDVTLSPVLGIVGTYSGTLPTIPQAGGMYTWTGSGGKGAGSFTSTVNLSPLIQWTNQSAAANVDRSKGLKVTWTGGNPGSLVDVHGSSSLSSNGFHVTVSYTCMEHVEAGQLTVPPYILLALPESSIGETLLTNEIFFPLSADQLDYATGLAEVNLGVSTSYVVAKK
jgi:uncharacterized protein (TIGR03437 family)